MDMNIGINANANRTGFGAVGETGAASAANAKPAARQQDNITIRSAETSELGGIPAIDFPDEEAARSDRLGKLVNAAFSLPPPPPPPFL